MRQAAGIPIDQDDPAFVTALARGLAVIQSFGPERDRQTLSDISRMTDLPRATVRRSLLTLQSLGFIAVDGKHFALTPSILSLGYAYLSATPLPRLIQPALEGVTEQIHESCSATILDRDEIIYVARAATKRIMSLGLSVGTRLPAYCTSMGRVLLAAEPQSLMRERLRKIKLSPMTQHTVTDPDALAEIIAKARNDGYCLVDEELELGLRSLAVPVRNAHGAVVAAMNVSAQAGRISSVTMLEHMLPVLHAAAESLAPILVS